MRLRKARAAGNAFAVAAALASSFAASPASADCPSPGPTTIPIAGSAVAPCAPPRHEGKRLTWDPGFDRMDAPEMVVTGVSVGVAIAAAIVKPLDTHWQGPILFDEAVRNALRAPSYQSRLDVRDASDVGLGVITTFPILVDSLIVAYWYRGSEDVGLQMALIDAETLAVASAVQGAATFFSGRQRPYVPGCGTVIGANTIDCTTTGEDRSFFSGHSTLSFASASLICAHHMALDLFENAADPITCATAMLAAGTVATLRVVGDMHYASDVLMGAIVGTALGLGIPLLHHYKRGAPTARTSLQVVPSLSGAAVVGTF